MVKLHSLVLAALAMSITLTGSGIGISATMDDTDQSVRFLEQLMAGNQVAVKNSRGDRLAVFSLNGSFAAISNLMTCWNRITASSDPFQ